MKFRIAAALAVLFAGVGLVAAQGPPPPMLGSAVPPPGAAGNLPAAPALPPEAFYDNTGGTLLYTGADYLLWKIRGFNLPSTVSAVPVGLIAVDVSDLFTADPAVPGVPGQLVTGFVPISINSQGQFGSSGSSDPGLMNGARITIGAWTDPTHAFGIEGSGFILERGIDNQVVTTANQSNQFILNTGFQRTVFLVQPPAAPSPLRTFGVFVNRETAGSIGLTTSTSLYGGEVNLRGVGLKIGNVDIGTLAGVRYLHLKDELSAFNSVRFFQPAGLPPTQADATASLSRDLTFTTVDRVRIWNNFVGPQVGFDVDAKFGAFFINARLKGAVGPVFQLGRVSSSTSVVNNDVGRPSPAALASAGGLLSGPGDAGEHTRTRYGFVPEVNLKVGYQVLNGMRIYAGYDGIYMGHVARAGLSTTTNSLTTTVTSPGGTNTAGASQPAFRLADHDAWAQGLSMGFELLF
jgi:hypothetical protein